MAQRIADKQFAIFRPSFFVGTMTESSMATLFPLNKPDKEHALDGRNVQLFPENSKAHCFMPVEPSNPFPANWGSWSCHVTYLLFNLFLLFQGSINLDGSNGQLDVLLSENRLVLAAMPQRRRITRRMTK
jgi:hypothetical protein